MKNQATNTSGLSSYSADRVEGLTWIKCVYNGKPRFGLDMGDDERPGTNNRVVLTLDGIRTFDKDKMVGLRVVDVDLSGADAETLAALARVHKGERQDAMVVMDGMDKVVVMEDSNV